MKHRLKNTAQGVFEKWLRTMTNFSGIKISGHSPKIFLWDKLMLYVIAYKSALCENRISGRIFFLISQVGPMNNFNKMV